MWRFRAGILSLYLLWAVLCGLSVPCTSHPAVFAFLVFFQFFVPGFTLGAGFGLLRRGLIEVILYSGILSYMVFVLATVPTMFFRTTWPGFFVINACLYCLILVFFLVKKTDTGAVRLPRPPVHEVLVLLLGVLVIGTYSYVNYRNDATYYNHMISATLESEHYGDKLYSWQLAADGSMRRETGNLFQLNYIQYYNFLAFPQKVSGFDQRVAWLLYHKLFAFLSLLSVYAFGRAVFNPLCGALSLLFYLVTVFPLGAYYYYPTGEIGLLFFQAGHAKQVSQTVFLFAFYATLLSGFRLGQRRFFWFAGAILLAMLTIHQISFVYGIFNYAMFSLMILAVALRKGTDLRAQAVRVVQNGLCVAAPPAVYLLLLFLSSAYFKEFMFYHTQWSKSQWDDAGSMAIKRWGLFDKLKSLMGRAKVLVDASVIIGVPFWLRRKAWRTAALFEEPGALFLFSNLLLYLLLKFPLFNILTHFDFTTGRYVDALLLSYCILAFIIAYALSSRRFLRYTAVFTSAVTVLAAAVYAGFGMNHAFADSFRSRLHIAGDTYLAMTRYSSAIAKGSGRGVTVLTDMKSSVDVFAFLNAYVFQFEQATLYPYSLNKQKLDEIDRLVFEPHKDPSAVAGFLGTRRVDYIVVPTVRTPWVTGDRIAENPAAVEFYKRLNGYGLVYSDAYYYVFKRLGG